MRLDVRQGHEHYLHRLAIVPFEIAQEPQFFEHVRMQMLRFVDDDERLAALAIEFETRIGDGQTSNLLRESLVRQTQIEQDRLQQIAVAGHVAVRQQDWANLLIERFEQLARDQCLARARAAGQEHDAFVGVQRPAKLAQGIFVGGRRKVRIGIGDRSKRPAAQPESRFEHGAAFLPE